MLYCDIFGSPRGIFDQKGKGNRINISGGVKGFEYEFVTTYRSYQHILFKGYVWFDREPYHMECEIELHIDEISYMWNEK